MSSTSHPASPDLGHSLWSAFVPLLPFMGTVFLGFLAMGMAMPVVPLHVHDTLGMGALIVGIVMGSQYGSAFFARAWAGGSSDRLGPRQACLHGLLGACAVGGIYFLSLAFADRPELSTGILLAGRLATGVAESFIMTPLLAWGIARVGPAHAGKVIGWIGMALFAAYGVGAPIGMAVHERFGFGGVAVAQVLVPLLALAIMIRIPRVAPTAGQRPPFWHVLRSVKLPGAALTLCSAGFAMMMAFITLLFAQRSWGGAALAITCLGGGFVVARLFFGHLPDKLGGAKVSALALLFETLGLLLVWGAPVAAVAWVGAALVGGGYAIAFQGFGVEAVRRAPPESRGAAMGAYVAFQDLAMVTSAPLGGLLAQWAGVGSVYLAAALGALAAAALAWSMRTR